MEENILKMYDKDFEDSKFDRDYPLENINEDSKFDDSEREIQSHNYLINEEQEDNLGFAFSASAKLVNPQVSRRSIVPGIKEEFILSPFEPGFGLTIGNALRRIMLSHMTGFAIAAIQIFGCTHRFQMILGIRETVADILMNIKGIHIKVNKNVTLTSFFATIDKQGPGDVLAKDLIMEHGTVCNPEQFICSLDVNGSFKAKLLICFGRGYVIGEKNKFINTVAEEDEFLDMAMIMDSTYNHIKQIEYIVEPTRVEEKTDYDKLIIKIETTGAITPKECLGRAYQLLWHQMSPIKNFDNFDIQMEEQEKEQNKNDIPDIMFVHVNKIGLSTRVRNGLEVNNIEYIGDLVTKTEQELTRSPRIGKESIREIKTVLNNLNFDLSLGMTIKGWRPPNIEKISDIIVREELIGG